MALKGFLFFCGLLLTVTLGWAALTHLKGRETERIVGALDFLDRSIDETRQFTADLYAPAIRQRAGSNLWAVSGAMITRDSVPGRPRHRTGHGTFLAVLENLCVDYADPACWRLVTLSVDGQALSRSRRAPSFDTNRIAAEPTANAVEASADDPAAPPSPVTTAAVSSAPVSAPLEDDTPPRHESSPCVDPAAWGDPDLARNRQFITEQAICLRAVEFVENGVTWRFQVLDSGRPGMTWAVLHDDENAAFDSALYAIVTYGGKVVDVEQRLSLSSDTIIDPNHNFAATDGQKRTCGEWISHAASVFTSTIMNELGPPPYLALHNNHDGHKHNGGSGNISVGHSARGLYGLPAYDARGRLADEDNFIVVSGRSAPGSLTGPIKQLTDELRHSGVNVIYEHVQEESNDCSLSNYLLLYGGAEPGQYFNVEAEAGDYQSQITMIDVLIGTLSNALDISQSDGDFLLADKTDEAAAVQP